MQALLTFLFASIEQVVFLAICLLGAGFLIWFLVALVLDEKRMRARRRTGFVRHQAYGAMIRVDSTKSLRRRPHAEDSGNDTRGSALNGEHWGAGRVRASQVSVLRLSDKEVEQNAIKLRWLLMVLLLSATFLAQTAGSTSLKDLPITQTPDRQIRHLCLARFRSLRQVSLVPCTLHPALNSVPSV